MRQDPPFDLAYITATHFLERIHPKTLVVNDPAHVRNAPEKIFVTQFPHLMPPTLISRDKQEIEEFRREHGEVVMKPLYGHGGASVFKVGREDPNFGSLYDLFANLFREPWVIQRFLPKITEGDKRIILIDGEAAGAINRVPAANDIRSNMVRGGAAKPTDLTPREREICETIGPRPQAHGPHPRRHRRDRRQPHRDQRDGADRHSRHQAPRRAGSGGDGVGRDRGQGEAVSNASSRTAQQIRDRSRIGAEPQHCHPRVGGDP